MGQMGRPGLSAAQKADLWHRWKQGQSLSEIGRALGKHAGSIHGVVSSHGGFIPAVRRRSRWTLTLAEREEISRGMAADASIRQIAAKLGRPPSTVSRELHRHGGPTQYRAADADAQAWERARRPKPCRLATHPPLQRMVAHKLTLDWSPEQISGWLTRTFPHHGRMRVSPETIYRSLFIQARGVLKKALLGHLRSRRMMRRAKRASTAGQPRGQIIDGLSIRDRPAEVADRAIPGHWEGDLMTGSKNTHPGYVSGTSVTLHDAGEGARKRHGQCGDRAEPTRAHLATGLAPILDLGSRDGIGPPQTIHYRDRCARVLL
jgi:hypothetical protein